MTAMHWLAIALGGSLGAVFRFTVVQWAARSVGAGFPWGTLAVNYVGSLMIGLAFVFFALKYPLISGHWRSFVMVGVLGAFTTFSSFALEALALVLEQQIHLALIYVLSSVIGCLLFVGIGYGLGKLIV